MDENRELLEEFVADAKEHLDTVEDDLLALEKQKDRPDREIVDRVFRAVHSVKGAAGFFGLTNISELAHVMETLLSLIREGEIRPESRFIDALLSGADHLGILLDDAEHSNEIDIADIHNRVSTILAQELSPEVKAEMAESVKLCDMADQDTGFEISAFTLKTVPARENLYVLKYNLTQLDQSGRRPMKLIQDLLEAGHILDAKIRLHSDDLRPGLPDEPLLYDVLYATGLNAEEIGAGLGVFNEFLIPVRRMEEKTQTDLPAAAESSETGTESDAETQRLVSLLSGGEHADTVRLHVDILDKLMMLVGELVLIRNQKLLKADSANPQSFGLAKRLNTVTAELQERIMRIRMQPLDSVFGRFPRIVRDLGQRLGKKIQISVSGAEVDLDRTLLESLIDPLTHLIRNSCDHGIESPAERIQAGKPEKGTITLGAWHDAGQIHVEIRDDGRGISPDFIRRKVLQKGLKTEAELRQMSEREILSLILIPGFSTTDAITEVSGRGVGMDVVKTGIESAGGSLETESVSGEGTRIHISLPLTLAIIPCLIVLSGGNPFAIPQISIEELVCLYEDDRRHLECAGDQEIYRMRGKLLPMIRLCEVLKRPEPFTEKVRAEIAETYGRTVEKNAEKSSADAIRFAVLKTGAGHFGLIADEIAGTGEIVVKPMHRSVSGLKIYAGAAIMGDGRVALILDAEGIARHAGIGAFQSKGEDRFRKKIENEALQDVLLFRSGKNEQFALSLSLIRRIEKIKFSDREKVGENEFISLKGTFMQILRLDKVLRVSPCMEKEEMFLIVPKHVFRPAGLLISEIIGTQRAEMEPNAKTCMEDGLLGTALIRGRMTLFVDLYRVMEKFTPMRAEIPDRETSSAEKSKKILLAEDTPFFRQLIKTYLESAGYEVETAENGQMGLEKLENSRFDLIVSDIEMPVMDGWEFMQNVRKTVTQKQLPALALTALDSEQTRQKAKECGFDRYEVKMDKKRFLSTVAEMLSA
ncbi:MAG: hybrid sensor histidine kinase/response regulator [Desulfobacterales bacterium]